MEAEKVSDKVTITRLIEDNHNLISTFAIFATLSALANNLPNKDVAKFLSFVLFTLSLMIGIEIRNNFPWTDRGMAYRFRELFDIFMILFVGAWVVTFYPAVIVIVWMSVVTFVVGVAFVICMTMIRLVISKLSLFKTTSKRMREGTIPMLGTMLIMLAVALVFQHFTGVR